MANYIYKIKSVKYGTPTGSNTMPASGSLTALPYTVKGSVQLSETDGQTEEYKVDQLTDPIMVVATESGKLEAQMKFYDMDYTAMAALKGGVGNASGYAPASGAVNVLKALQIDTVSGHRFDFYNAHLLTKIGPSGSSDGLLTLDTKVTALAATDGAGSWHVGPIS
jgi:hypothetical protein